MNQKDRDLYLALCNRNTELIYSCEDDSFRKYGVCHYLDQTELLTQWAESVLDPDGPVYVPHYPSADRMMWKKTLEESLYGGFPLQIGSCCGVSLAMNGMEYHKGHEFILALTNLVLFLGDSRDIVRKDRWIWDSSRGTFYFIPKGLTIELYSTTMHLAPCRVGSDPFRSLIILPAGTNLDLEIPPPEDNLLFKKNKWMICHPESPAAKRGAYIGISGPNRQIKALEPL